MFATKEMLKKAEERFAAKQKKAAISKRKMSEIVKPSSEASPLKQPVIKKTKAEALAETKALADKKMPSVSRVRELAMMSNRASGMTKKNPMGYYKGYKAFIQSKKK